MPEMPAEVKSPVRRADVDRREATAAAAAAHRSQQQVVVVGPGRSAAGDIRRIGIRRRNAHAELVDRPSLRRAVLEVVDISDRDSRNCRRESEAQCDSEHG